MKSYSGYLCLAICLLAAGCVTGEKINRLAPGMTEARVVSVMGHPDAVRLDGNDEIYRYNGRLISGWSYDRADFALRFRNGALVEYGPVKVYHIQREVNAANAAAAMQSNQHSAALDFAAIANAAAAGANAITYAQTATSTGRVAPALPTQQQLNEPATFTGSTQMAADGTLYYEYRRVDGTAFWSAKGP